MHMALMLGILAAVFFIALFIMCFFRERLNHPFINPLFISVCAVFFFCWNFAMFEHRGSNFRFMTLENISPYICTVILLTPFMVKWLKDSAYCAIAFLGFGMFVALFISPGVEYLFNYKQEVKLIHITEAACHLVMALYGFYLILANKVKLEFKDFGKALAFIYSAIGFGVFINLVFHQSNFGMDMYGKYSIYFLDIFGSFGVTLIAYLVGVLAVMALGYLTGAFLDKVSHRHHGKKEHMTSYE